MKYTFQQSYIFEGSNNDVDPRTKEVTIKMKPGKTQLDAISKLPPAELGRHWILTKIGDNKVDS